MREERESENVPHQRVAFSSSCVVCLVATTNDGCAVYVGMRKYPGRVRWPVRQKG